ncbi:MAG: hypothetical protein JOY90_24580 [Bradyrhizobium sp.]|uniref:hypothetical protein n=1 Tax=Bradyrhizobium sp. TaxID=376 RepID=UPI001D847C8D|nr:hypothetical protein [Bradyrhizobium sp.]MBV9563594.1 hypothetical protein [Bradyrhizobium sp.]
MPSWLLAAVCLVELVVSPARGQALPAPGQTIVAATTYGEFITEDDVEQRTRLDFLTSQRQASREDVIRQLVIDMARMREAEGSGLLTNASVDKAFGDMCSRLGVAPVQMTKSLEEKGIRLDTLRQRLKADIAREILTRMQSHGFEDRLDRPLIPQK